jgi:hypothetical protein
MRVYHITALILLLSVGRAAAQDAGSQASDPTKICMDHRHFGRPAPDANGNIPTQYEPAFSDLCTKLDLNRAKAAVDAKAAKDAADLKALTDGQK